MRVVIVETGGWGGIGHYAWNLCEALAGQHAIVHLITNIRFELSEVPRRFTLEPCFDKNCYYLQNARRLFQTIDRIDPSVVHVQSLLSTRFDAFMWPVVKRKTPLIMTAHNIRSHEVNRWESWTTWRSYACADALVVHTQESASIAGARLRGRPPVHVIHHGDYGFFAPKQDISKTEARRRLGLPEEGPILLTLGAIRPYKGILELFRAIPPVCRKHPRTHLVVAGPMLVGSEEQYRMMIEKSGLKEKVIFRPEYIPHSDVHLYFKASDLAIYNYHDITDSGALRIACSLGIPVVATSVGAFQEFLEDGITGRLVPPHDLQALVGAINDCLDDPGAAGRMAAAALKLSATIWSWSDAARKTLYLYRELIGVSKQ
jgi:glycosyltransferase involved in cell wall biosynthesis